MPGEIELREARLAVIKAARERLEARQTERNKEKGRDPEDDRRPKGKDGKPKGGCYKRDFGLPEDTAQGSFADPDIRIMKGAGRGFDQSYAPKEIPPLGDNAHTVVDGTAQIIAAAELSNNAADADRLPVLIDVVRVN